MIEVQEPKFIVGDAQKLDFIEDESIDLIITSPPYLSVNPDRYGGRSDLQLNYSADEDVMINRLMTAFSEMSRVLKHDGVIVINIGDAQNNDSSYKMFPEKFILNVLNQGSFRLNSDIIIKDEITSTDFTNSNYLKWYVLFRGHPFVNEYYAYRYRTKLWLTETELPMPEILKLNGGILDSFPPSFAERVMKIYTLPGDTILDPFGGLGTVAISAYENNRNGISVDISIDQKLAAKQNFDLYKKGLIK